MDKMTNDERRRIAGIIRSIRSEIHASCKITTRELAMERLDQLADEIDAPEREYPTEGEYKKADGKLFRITSHRSDKLICTFNIFTTPADRRMFEKAREMYSLLKNPFKSAMANIGAENIIDYIETGADNGSS